MKLLRKKIIYGCESRGDGDSPYLTRLTLIETRLGAIYLHRFHRSDADEHHDHPWAFASVILWRGYIEETVCPDCGGTGKITGVTSGIWPYEYKCYGCDGLIRKRVWPLMVLFRKATHRHSVRLVDGKPAVTLIVRGPYVRDWGFFTRAGWQQWREYFKERGC